MFGRSFNNTAGLGQPFDRVIKARFSRSLHRLDDLFFVLTFCPRWAQVVPGTDVYPYKVLPISGAQVFENTVDVTSFSYDARGRQLVSYDTPHIAALKAKYVQANGLAGSMFWEVCRPRPRPRPLISRRGSSLNIWRVSCPWIRQDPRRLLVLPPGNMVALTRRQYVHHLRNSHKPN